MGKINKLIGSVVGAVVGWAVIKFALPAEFGGKEVVDALTLLITTGIGVYYAPKNTA